MGAAADSHLVIAACRGVAAHLLGRAVARYVVLLPSSTFFFFFPPCIYFCIYLFMSWPRNSATNPRLPIKLVMAALGAPIGCCQISICPQRRTDNRSSLLPENRGDVLHTDASHSPCTPHPHLELETLIAVSCWGRGASLVNLCRDTYPVNRLPPRPPFWHVAAQQGGAAEGKI